MQTRQHQTVEPQLGYQQCLLPSSGPKVNLL